MATYVHNKSRAFKTTGDPSDLPLNSNSLFHLKSYSSATDPRAWSNDTIQRKQYFLDMFVADDTSQPDEIFIGKYINIQALLKTLLTNKDADILYLQNQLTILESYFEELGLSDMQRNALSIRRTEAPGGDVSIWTALTSRKSTTDLTLPTDSQINVNNHDILISELNKKFEEQDLECARQKELAHDAIQRLTSLKAIVEERDLTMRENERLERKIELLENSKSSSSNDLALKSEIVMLRLELDKKKETKPLFPLSIDVYKDQVAIQPQRKHDFGNMQSETEFTDFSKVIEERDYLKVLVANLLMQVENMKRCGGSQISDVSNVSAVVVVAPPPLQEHANFGGDYHHVQSQVGMNIINELDTLRMKAKDFEIKSLECDRLRLRISELGLIEKEYDSIKLKYNNILQEHRQNNAQNLNMLGYYKEQCIYLQNEIARYKQCAEENHMLSDRSKKLQCVIDSLQARIRFIESIQPTSTVSHAKMKELIEDLETKSNIIRLSDEKLFNLQQQLKDTINSLNCESTILKNSLRDAHLRINGLLDQENNNQAEIKQLKDDLDSKDILLQNALRINKNPPFLKKIQDRDNLIAQLQKKLLEMKQENERLSAIGIRMQSYFEKKSTLMIHKSISDCNLSRSSLKIGRKRMDSIHSAMQKLQKDLSDAKLSCDNPNFFLLQGRYKEIQCLAKNQVHWLAAELRKCKIRVQCLESNVKNETIQ